MRQIQMVDLRGQYNNIKSEIDSAIQSVIDDSAFINGPQVNKFKNSLANYLDIPHVITCANGTDALQIALMALDLNPGDEIITPDFTFIATVEAAAILGLKPVIVDVDPKTFCIDPIQIRKSITPKTKAIIPVHLFGQAADMDSILQIAEEFNLYVIEDNAQAFGADYNFNNNKKQKLGTIGHIGCTSFFPSKNLGCYGDGGAIFTKDPILAEKINSIVNHGSKVKYYHDIIGVNSRLDTIQAALLDVKIKYIDKYNSARQKAASYYDEKLSIISQINIPARNAKSTHVFHQYTLKINSDILNTDLQKYLSSKNIPSMIYYPQPMHKQKAFEKFCDSNTLFPVSDNLCNKVLSLPMHTELDEEQLNYITNNIIEYFN